MDESVATTSVPTIIDYAERRRTGLRLYEEIMAVAHPAPTSPRSATLIDFIFAEIWSRPGLTRRERRLVTITCLAGADAHSSLADHVYGALATADLTVAELDEWVLHFAVYCGWGKAEICESIIDEQAARLASEKGQPAPVRALAPLTTVSEDQELRKQGGEAEFREVNYVPAPQRGVPYYDDGILNFVFGDMWKRAGLNRRDRRFITLACVGLDDTVGPIHSHVYSALKSGEVTYPEMREVVLQFAAYCGWPKGSMMQATADGEWARVRAEAEAGLVRGT
jgi:4-carboxymuconolactone decarboxylase